MDEYFVVFIIIALIVLSPMVIYIIFKPMKQQNKLIKNIRNYNSLMRCFVFRIDLNKDEFFSRLKLHNVKDVMQYSLSEDLSVITFKKNSAEISYNIYIKPFDEFILLKVSQIELIANGSNIPYYVNKFFILKFNAKPLEYEKTAF